MTEYEEANTLIARARDRLEEARSLLDAASATLKTVDPDVSERLEELEGDTGDLIHELPGELG